MKLKNFLWIFLSLVLVAIVSADIISVNSGGSSRLIINPNLYLEGFFFMENRAPVVTSVILNSTFGTNLTTENLTAYISSYDPDNNPITNITDWRIGGKSLMIFNFPFDTKKDSGTTRDYSTNEYNATIGISSNNIPVWNESCVVGGCYYFDGENDTIYGSQSISNTGADGITIGGWVYMLNSDASTYETVAVIGYQGASAGYHWLYIQDASGTLIWQYSNGSGYKAVSRAAGIPQNTWTHVAVSHNYTSGDIKFYKNGEFLATVNYGDFPISIVNKPFRIGTYYTTTSYEFNGSLDEIFAYNRTLSDAQIKQIYTDNLNGRHLEKFVSEETNVGEIWQVAVTASDKLLESPTVLSNELTIVNSPPNNPNPVLVSVDGSNETDADLNCSSKVTDTESNSLTVFTRWIRNGTIQFTLSGSFSNNSMYYSILNQGNLTVGDIWKCEVRVYDGADYSDWVESNELKIIDATAPNITIISPEPINYTTTNIYFNVSINENASVCFYNVDFAGNNSLTKLNATYFWILNSSLGPGEHNVTFYCNDTSNNWGMNYTNFTILNEAAIAILLSDELLQTVKWNVVSLPADDLNAIGNNFENATSYYINISATNTLVDLYVKANGDLVNEALDVLKLGNETYSFSSNDSKVNVTSKITMTTNYSLIADGVGDNSTVYMKFYLDAPSTQPAGVYLNNLDFKAVRHGQGI